jgi:hypothetical protein
VGLIQLTDSKLSKTFFSNNTEHEYPGNRSLVVGGGVGLSEALAAMAYEGGASLDTALVVWKELK